VDGRRAEIATLATVSRSQSGATAHGIDHRADDQGDVDVAATRNPVWTRRGRALAQGDIHQPDDLVDGGTAVGIAITDTASAELRPPQRGHGDDDEARNERAHRH
jgi:hypothetical protein